MYESHRIKLTSAGKKFWGTKKNHMTIIVVNTPVELYGGYWDGGSRNEYWNLTQNGGHMMLNYPTSPREYGGGEPPKILPAVNEAIVQGGVFCGKVSGLIAYVTKLDGWMHPEYGIEVQKIKLS